MNPDNVLRLVDSISREKNVEKEVIFDAIEQALIIAARRKVEDPDNVAVAIDRETGEIHARGDAAILNIDELGRIAAQTAKQVIIQKIREAEKDSVLTEFNSKKGEIVSGTVQRMERGTLYVDLGRTTGVLPYEEQLPGERYRPAERIRAYLYAVDETPRGVFLRLSRSHPQFLVKLFEIEAPEVASGMVMIKAVAREAGSRSKVAVHSADEHIDPIGSLVGQRGVRVSTVMSELANEKIDIIEWSDDPARFIEDSLSPARTLGVVVNQAAHTAMVEVAPDQQSLAIGKGGQNVRLAAKLTGWKIDIHSAATFMEEKKSGNSHETEEVEASEQDSKIEPAEEKTEAVEESTS